MRGVGNDGEYSEEIDVDGGSLAKSAKVSNGGPGAG